MSLIPETKDKNEKQVFYLDRFNRWVSSRPENEKKLFCEHGRYTGFKGALRYMCCYCSEEEV